MPNIPVQNWLSDLVAAESDIGQLLDPTSDEAAFKARWQQQVGSGAGSLAPVWQAAAGGALAPNLSMVFAAGYQAALRHVLAEPFDERWLALVVSEDAQQPELNPPTVYTVTAGGLSINGTKSWVAASRNVDEMIVRASPADGLAVTSGTAVEIDARWFRVKVDVAGVELQHRGEASFLPDLSQGFARFHNVEIPQSNLLQAEPFTDFFLAEALLIPSALVGHILARWRQQLNFADVFAKRSLSQEALIQGLSLLELASSIAIQPPGIEQLLRLHGMHQQLETLVALFEQEVVNGLGAERFAQEWQRDRRLCRMYHNGVGKQVAVQLREAHEGL